MKNFFNFVTLAFVLFSFTGVSGQTQSGCKIGQTIHGARPMEGNIQFQEHEVIQFFIQSPECDTEGRIPIRKNGRSLNYKVQMIDTYTYRYKVDQTGETGTLYIHTLEIDGGKYGRNFTITNLVTGETSETKKAPFGYKLFVGKRTRKFAFFKPDYPVLARKSTKAVQIASR